MAARALPASQVRQSTFQSPNPLSKGAILAPPLLTTSTMSPSRTVSKNQAASSVLMPVQPWLTFSSPCASTDQGAAWMYSPLQVTRVA